MLSAYQKLIASMDSTVDARAVEAWMRLEYSTLDHLPRETFRQYIGITKKLETAAPGEGTRLADSYGL